MYAWLCESHTHTHIIYLQTLTDSRLIVLIALLYNLQRNVNQSVLIELCCINLILIGITLRQGAQMKDWKLKKSELYSETTRTTAVLPVKTRRESKIETDPGAVRETETGTITANPPGTAGGAAGTDTGTVARTITLTRYDHCLSPIAVATVCFLCFSFLLYGLWEFLISNIV